MNTRLLLLPCLVIGLSGCATAPKDPLASDYSGPKAWLEDTTSLDKNERDQIFALIEVDGVRVNNALDNTRRASQGKGFSASLRTSGRAVAARKSRFKLIGTHFSAAPIGEIARRAAGTFQSIDGIIEFAPEDAKKYEVKGELSKERSCVWVEDTATNLVVADKVCSK
jgi:hypothetical protein